MKKKYIKNFIMIVCLSLSIKFYAQGDILDKLNNFQENLVVLKAQSGELSKKIVDKKIFLFPSWSNRCKLFNKQKSYKINNINFDFVNSSFYFRESAEKYYLIKPSSIDSIYIGNKKFYKKSINQIDKFIEVLNNNKGNLFFKTYTGKFVEGKLNPLSGIKETKDKFKKVEKYFIEKNDKLTKVKLKKRILFDKLFIKNKKRVIEYSEKNKLSFNKEKDVIKIINYYNSL